MPMMEPGACSRLRRQRDDLFVDHRADGDAVDPEPTSCSVIRLYQDGDAPCPTTTQPDLARRRPDPAFEVVTHHSGATADGAFDYRLSVGGLHRGSDVRATNVESIDVVQESVPRLTYDWQAPEHLTRRSTGHLLGDQAVPHQAEAMGVGQHNRRQQQATLPYPLQTGHFACAVQAMESSEDAGVPRVGLMRKDDGHARSDRAASDYERTVAPNDGRVPDAHPRDVGDCIAVASGKGADRYPEVTSPHRDR